MPLLALFLSTALGILTRAIRKEEDMKVYKVKKEVKLSPLRNYIIHI